MTLQFLARSTMSAEPNLRWSTCHVLCCSSFFDGTTQLGTGILSAGIATYTSSSLAAGTHSITVSYSGDANFKPATSLSITETIEDFTSAVPSGSSTSAAISKGGSATYTLAVTPPSGATTPRQSLWRSRATGATSTFSPSAVAAGSGSINVNLTVSVPASAAVRAAAGTAPPPPTGKFPVALGVLLLPLLRLRSPRSGRPGPAALRHAGACNRALRLRRRERWLQHSAAPAADLTLTVTATAGSLSHSTALTLTVQ